MDSQSPLRLPEFRVSIEREDEEQKKYEFKENGLLKTPYGDFKVTQLKIAGANINNLGRLSEDQEKVIISLVEQIFAKMEDQDIDLNPQIVEKVTVSSMAKDDLDADEADSGITYQADVITREIDNREKHTRFQVSTQKTQDVFGRVIHSSSDVERSSNQNEDNNDDFLDDFLEEYGNNKNLVDDGADEIRSVSDEGEGLEFPADNDVNTKIDEILKEQNFPADFNDSTSYGENLDTTSHFQNRENLDRESPLSSTLHGQSVDSQANNLSPQSQVTSQSNIANQPSQQRPLSKKSKKRNIKYYELPKELPPKPPTSSSAKAEVSQNQGVIEKDQPKVRNDQAENEKSVKVSNAPAQASTVSSSQREIKQSSVEDKISNPVNYMQDVQYQMNELREEITSLTFKDTDSLKRDLEMKKDELAEFKNAIFLPHTSGKKKTPSEIKYFTCIHNIAENAINECRKIIELKELDSTNKKDREVIVNEIKDFAHNQLDQLNELSILLKDSDGVIKKYIEEQKNVLREQFNKQWA